MLISGRIDNYATNCCTSSYTAAAVAVVAAAAAAASLPTINVVPAASPASQSHLVAAVVWQAAVSALARNS
jgi:hypothetical protein